MPLIVIDRRHQGRGYGRQGMKAIAAIRQQALDCRAIGLGCKPDNKVGMHLYEGVGFVRGGMMPAGSFEMWLEVEPSS